MFYPRWKPWANIPRKYTSFVMRSHTIISTCLILFCVVFIISGLSASVHDSGRKQYTVQDSIAILVDTSLSMSAADVKPNRYSHALAIASGLLQQYNAQYVTIPFGAIPMVRTPLSYDRTGIQQVLWEYTLGSYHVNDVYMGSAPWNAIGLARSFLHKQSTPNKTIVLLGDGNTNTWYTIDTFIPYLQQDNIQVIICAIGQSWYVLGTNYADTPVISSLDVNRLDSITQQTNWKRRVCNDIPQAVDRITMRLKDRILLANNEFSLHSFDELRNNTTAQYAVLIGIGYMILTSFGTYLRYDVHAVRKKKKGA